MRALRYESFGGAVTIVDAPDPTPGPGAAIVEVARTGLCRSDWHGWRGHDSDTALPCIPGHEFTGTVIEAPEAPEWLGKRVAVPFVMACGTCPECTRGHGQVCRAQRQPGFTDQGSFAAYVPVVAAHVNLVALPDAIGDDAAAALGCRYATAWRALTAVAQLQEGERLAVFGAGGVGLAAIQIAVHLGAEVLALDISSASLGHAMSLGASAERIDATDSPQHIADHVRTLWPDGSSVSMDALGSPVLASAGVLGLARGGRHVQVGLLAEPLSVLPLGRVIAHELRILGSHGMAASDYPALLDAVESGLDPAALVTATLPLADAGPALMTMDAPDAPRGVRLIDPRR